VERVRAAAGRWRSLSEAEKQPWQERARAARETYRKQLSEYERRFVTPNAAPKRPMTGYTLFSSRRLPALQAAQPGRPVPDYMTQVGKEWKALPEEERRRLGDELKPQWEEYHRRRSDWEKKPEAEKLLARRELQGRQIKRKKKTMPAAAAAAGQQSRL
jgi:hypothetical protein